MVGSGSSSMSAISWSSDLAEVRDECAACTSSQPPDMLCRHNPCYDDDQHHHHHHDNCAEEEEYDDDEESSKRSLLICQRPRRPMPSHPQDKEWSNLVLMMKEIFAKLLLGDDFSGGSKGSTAALTISNAITKLSVAVFGNLPRLEPLSEENELKWRREMEWLVCPCDYIVELGPSRHSLQDGTTVEVMASKPRADVYVGLPALQKLDGMLVEILRSFGNAEFKYTERVCNVPMHSLTGCDMSRDSGMMWLPAVQVPACGLSEKARCHLAQERESANQILKAAKSINEHVLTEMEIPESYWQMLPKSGKKVIGDNPSLRTVVTCDHCCLETVLSSLECHSHKSLSNLASGLEALIHVWTLKIQNKLKQASYPEAVSCGATPTWAHVSKDGSLKKKLEKKRKYVERARSMLEELRNRYPGMLQTALELSKIRHNKDVGYAVLESYSRALVNMAARIETRIAEVISADKDHVLLQFHHHFLHHRHHHPDPPLATPPGGATTSTSTTTSSCCCSCMQSPASAHHSILHFGLHLEQALLLHHPHPPVLHPN